VVADSFVLRNRQLLVAAKRYNQADEKDDDTMTMKFWLHKDKEENKENAYGQKQECGYPSPQPFLRTTHSFLINILAMLKRKW
jgi:hypothetical protein